MKTMDHGQTGRNIEDDEIEFTIKIRRSQIAHLGAVLLGGVATPMHAQVVHERDADIEQKIGCSARTFADACRAGVIEGAVRTTARGWRASREAVDVWLIDRRRPRRRAAPPVVAPAPDTAEQDRQLLAQAGQARRAR